VPPSESRLSGPTRDAAVRGPPAASRALTSAKSKRGWPDAARTALSAPLRASSQTLLTVVPR